MSTKTHINARQIKAARALLDWSQEDLADASGLSIATIRKIESGAMSPRDKTMGGIILAFIENGIDFTDSTGVRIKNDVISVIEGGSCFQRLLDEIYLTTKNRSGEVLFMYADSSKVTEAEMLSHLRLRKAGNKYRILTKEGNTYLHFPLSDYRWVPEKFFQYSVVVIYQKNVAICVYEKTTDSEMSRVIIVKNDSLAEAMQGTFNFMWDNCRKPTLTTAPQVYE